MTDKIIPILLSILVVCAICTEYAMWSDQTGASIPDIVMLR